MMMLKTMMMMSGGGGLGIIRPRPPRVNASFTPITRQMSMKAESIASRLNSSGLLQTKGLIGGKWTDAYDGKTLEVCNPATGNVIANVSCMGGKETDDAIASAQDAFNYWSKLTAADRSNRLRKWYNLIIEHKEELGQLITLEQGKPLKEAIGEVSYGASFIEFFAEEAKRVYGDVIPATLADRRLFVLKQPVGVVGAITPWNFPLAMITRKVGPALACGCTVVIKPSELTPLTALAAAELSLQAGIPPGAINVVMGNASDIGNALVASPQVRAITFTGSTAVGKKLMKGAAETVKKVSLELGGNAPCIIFDDADLEVAVKGTLATKFRNTGQTCVCANRIIVQEGDLLMAKYPNLYWTPCAAHCLDLMLEDIYKKPILKKTLNHAMKLNAYIYNRPGVVNMMRKFTKKELLRPAKTRFATAAITFSRLHSVKGNLRSMFTSEEWNRSKWAKETAGKQAKEVILSPSFWKHIFFALKVTSPLIKVLRLVDGERRPAMGYIYEAMDRAKEAIARSFNNDESKYKEMFEIIDDRWSVQLHQPLHAAGYFLNPQFFYKNENIESDEEVVSGLYTCIERLIPDGAMQDKITEELTLYKRAEGLFGKTMAIRQRDTRAPGIYEKFATALTKAVENLKVGDGFGEDVLQGPLINEAAVQKIESFVQEAVSKGASILHGGKRHSLGLTFYEPTVLGDVKNDMLIARQEVFGPVAPLLRFRTEKEAIHIANDTNAGLAAYLFTSNVQRSWRVSEALEYGIVGVNEGSVSTEVAPFGGVKQSGLGREGSKYGMDEFLEMKYVCMGNMS